MGSRSRSPEVCIVVGPREKKRAQGRPGARCTRGLVCAHRKRAHEHTGSAETLRPSLRSGFTAYFELSPVNGSFATVVPQEALLPKELDASTAASGPHDFAVRVMRFVSRAFRVHRSPHPTSVTIAIRPSCGRGISEIIALICPTGRAEYFSAKGWTDFWTDLPVGQFCRCVRVKRPAMSRASRCALRPAC